MRLELLKLYPHYQIFFDKKLLYVVMYAHI